MSGQQLVESAGSRIDVALVEVGEDIAEAVGEVDESGALVRSGLGHGRRVHRHRALDRGERIVDRGQWPATGRTGGQLVDQNHGREHARIEVAVEFHQANRH